MSLLHHPARGAHPRLPLLLLALVLASCVSLPSYRLEQRRTAAERRRADSLDVTLRAARDTAALLAADREAANAQVFAMRARVDSVNVMYSAAMEERRFEFRPGAVLAPLRFDVNSTAIQADDRAFLDTVATVLKEKPTLRLGLIGRADVRGTQDYNLDLSSRRAAAARDYLVQRGVESWRLDVVKAGETSPLDTRQSDAAFAMNRSVQLVVTEEAVPVLLKSIPKNGATIYFFSIWNDAYKNAYPNLGNPAALGPYRVSEGPTDTRIFRSPKGWNVMMVQDGKRAFLCGIQPKRPGANADTTKATANFGDPAFAQPCPRQ